MTDVRELIRRLRLGDTDRRIARDLGMSRNTVARYRVAALQHGWLEGDLPDPAGLAAQLHPAPTDRPPHEQSLVVPFREPVQRWHAQGVDLHRGPARAGPFKTEKGARLYTDMAHAPLPAGPAGAFSYHGPFHHGIMSYSKNPGLAKDFLRWFHGKDAFEPWFLAEKGYAVGLTRLWEEHAMWQQDPVMVAFRNAGRNYRLFGYAGPPSAKATEAYSKYIVVDLYAKAVQGMAPEDAARWAEGELRKIYGG